MKKSYYPYAISAVLAVAIIILYILHFTSSASNRATLEKNMASLADDSLFTLPVAYVNLDSLLTNYNFAQDLNESLMRKEESSRATLNQKQRQLQSAAETFQRNLQNNAFLSQERAQSEQQRIMKMQQDYEQMAQRLAQEFAIEQQKMNMEMEDTIKVRLKEFNATRNYQIIFSNTGTANILLADKKYDITKEVTDYLNKRYGPKTAPSTSSQAKEKK